MDYEASDMHDRKPQLRIQGPVVQKLTMSLVNVSLKLWSLNMSYMLIFMLTKCEYFFAFTKATHIVFGKNTC